MMSDFYPGILVAWQLDGVKFALGTTIATTPDQARGFRRLCRHLKTRPGDDLLVGRLGIAEQGFEVVLLPYVVETVPDYQSMRALIQRRLRWILVMRHMRPWGHLGLLLTQGLPWSIAAVAVHPTPARGAWIFRDLPGHESGDDVDDRRPRPETAPLLEADGPDSRVGHRRVFIWMTSFLRQSIRWRGSDYYIRNGKLVPVKD